MLATMTTVRPVLVASQPVVVVNLFRRKDCCLSQMSLEMYESQSRSQVTDLEQCFLE